MAETISAFFLGSKIRNDLKNVTWWTVMCKFSGRSDHATFSPWGWLHTCALTHDSFEWIRIYFFRITIFIYHFQFSSTFMNIFSYTCFSLSIIVHMYKFLGGHFGLCLIFYNLYLLASYPNTTTQLERKDIFFSYCIVPSFLRVG